jgi:hypothetical protein
VGATLALLGGIYILHLKSKKSYMTDIKRKIDALPPAKKEATGKVSFAYLKKIYYIAKHAALT